MDNAQTIDRRKEDSGFAALMLLVETIHVDLKNLDAKLSDHIIDESTNLAQQIAKLVHEGFPDGDLRKHRAEHEETLGNAADKKELNKKIREKTVSGLVWAAFVLIGVALWEYIKVIIHRT